MEETLIRVANVAKTLSEAVAVLIVTFGVLEAFLKLILICVTPGTTHGERKAVWRRLGTWLLMGLEFELAADIIGSVVSPSWQDIGQLGAIAVVRTFLNYFLEHDLEKAEASQEREAKRRSAEAQALGAMLFLLLAGHAVQAQGSRPSAEPPGQQATKAERDNELALVVAGTRDTKEHDTFFTLGVEYERRFSAHAGAIAEVEHLFDADRWIAAMPIVFRPVPGAKLFAGPGLERAIKEEVLAPGTVQETVVNAGHTTNFLVRIGAAYAVEFAERHSIGPTVSLDLIHEEGDWARAVVFGLNIGVGF